MTREAGWAVRWDEPSFAYARAAVAYDGRYGHKERLHPTLAAAYRMAAACFDERDRHKARVFWVVRDA